ncbi:hypothetical protein IWQ57_001572 [Coemansia nantahalensis]|uniref:Uncharacterized protein n=1 Tax=Coemansia nantahalensis TaxID=2789366 RepID=A0ACC1K4I8_9FUNG|nr:hypothetical protein IWQ57_001572 [Coemansia nantahalensis]
MKVRATDTMPANQEKEGAAQPDNGDPAEPARGAANGTGDGSPAEPFFVGMLPDEMSQWVDGGGGGGDTAPADPSADVTAEERELGQEAAALRTAEFVANIVAAMESGAALSAGF